jgi:hypothetical protein
VWSIANNRSQETGKRGLPRSAVRWSAPSRPKPPTDFVSVMLACQGNGQISQFGYLLIPLQPITAEPCIGQVLSAVVRGSDGPAGQVIIAYEPFWTIGALQPAPSAYVADVCQRVRIALADQLSDFALVYGGSAGPGLLTALGANVDVCSSVVSPTTREQLPKCSPKLPCPAGQGLTGEPDHEPPMASLSDSASCSAPAAKGCSLRRPQPIERDHVCGTAAKAYQFSVSPTAALPPDRSSEMQHPTGNAAADAPAAMVIGHER